MNKFFEGFEKTAKRKEKEERRTPNAFIKGLGATAGGAIGLVGGSAFGMPLVMSGMVPEKAGVLGSMIGGTALGAYEGWNAAKDVGESFMNRKKKVKKDE